MKSEAWFFLELDVRSADVVTFLYNGRCNSVHNDCGSTSRALRMSRIIVDLRVDSAEHTDTRATWALSHFNSFCICCYYLWQCLLKVGGIFIWSIYACRGFFFYSKFYCLKLISSHYRHSHTHYYYVKHYSWKVLQFLLN